MTSRSRVSRRTFALFAAGAWTVVSSGCGYLLYPERRGQPTGRLDWGVVLLDGLGLLLFFIPGLIAFAVDFATGTIYLPPGEYGKKGDPGSRRRLVKVLVPRDQLSKAKIEEIVSSHIGRSIELRDGEYFTEPMGSIDDFWSAAERAGRDRTESSSPIG